MTPLRTPAFRRLLWSTVAASGAVGMERTVTAWLALELGAGPLAIGVLFAVRMLPTLLLGLVAGTMADRIDRRRLLLVTGVAALALLAAFAALVAAGWAGIWLLGGFAFAAGCIHVFDTPARQALVLDTTGPEVAVRALALNALAGRLAPALGALAVGVMIPLGGVAGAYVATAALFGLMATLVATLPAPHDQRAILAPPPFGRALRDAARLILDAPVVRTLVLAGLVCEVFAFSHMSALPLFAQEVLAAGPAGLGALNAAASVGGALAVAALALLPERMPRKPLLGAIFLTYGLTIAALSAARSLPVAVAVLLIIGCCAGAFDVLQQTLLQLAVPAEQRGRAVGLWVLSIGSAPLGHLQMGLLMAALGVPTALLGNGLLTVAAALALLAWAPEYRLLRAPRLHP